MKTIVQNLAIEYRDEGAGPVMLFLHGWQDDLRTFDALVPLLVSEKRIIRVDLPGFGVSEKPKESWDLDNYARFVRDFIKKLDVSVDVLVGHSFGGRVVIKGEVTKVLHPRKIVLIASAGVARRRTLRNAAIKMLARIGKVITSVPPLTFWREKLRRRMYRFIGSDYASAGTLQETFLKIISEDLSESARRMNPDPAQKAQGIRAGFDGSVSAPPTQKSSATFIPAASGGTFGDIPIKTPALLIWGSRDSITPLSEGRRLSHLIFGAVLKVVDGAGHFVHREKPQEVAELIQEFVR